MMLKKGPWQRTFKSIDTVVDLYSRKIFLKKYKDIDIKLLARMQAYHDDLAFGYDTCCSVDELEEYTGYKLNELR